MPAIRKPEGSSKTQRAVGALFGVFLVGLALMILATSEPSTRLGAIAAAIVIGGLGLDLLHSAWRNRRSLLSRIGPLP